MAEFWNPTGLFEGFTTLICAYVRFRFAWSITLPFNFSWRSDIGTERFVRI